MTNRSALIVLLRLVMIYLSLQIATFYLNVLTNVESGMTPVSKLLLLVVGLSEILLFAVIIAFAGRIVDFLAPRSEKPEGAAAIGLDELQAIAFSAAGAVLIYAAVQSTFYMVAVLEQTYQTRFPTGSVISACLMWALGLYLLFGAPGLRQWLISLRRAGGKDRK